jgi:choline-glycine betaine transporter
VELGVGLSLALVFALVGVYFGWQQRHTLAQLRSDTELSTADRRYLVKQVRRRLICSFLIIVFAAMLVGHFFLEDINTLRPAEGEPLAEEAKDSLRFITWYWIVMLCVLMAILALASFDFLATARYGLRRVRELEHDRRTVLEMEAAKLRRRRQELN